MKIKKRITAASLLAAASLTFSSSAWSLGLGDITVESYLNQPLQVKIDLISRATDDMTSVTARLASAADYAMIGANLDSVPVPIRFAVEDIDGDAYIMGTSSLPISEPVVRLIVEVNWSSGRLLREYTVFLDPPTYSEPAPIPRVDKRKTPQAVVPAPAVQAEQEVPGASSETPAEQAGEAKTAAGAAPATEPVDGEYGPVGNGETLWGIASGWSRGTGLDINKVMIAIQRENPQAFLKDNINLLKRGAILRMPRVEDVRAIPIASAISQVSAQEEEFRGGSLAPTVTSAATPLLAEETAISGVEESGQPTEAAMPADEAVAVEVADEEISDEEIAVQEQELTPQLELVPPSEESDLDSAYGFEESEDSNADASVAVSTLREDLARTEEELVTQQQQNEYLAERIKELESQLASAEEGNVKSADLANMEDRLREQRLAETEAAGGEEQHWYSRLSAWLIGLLILAAAVAGWWFSRRGSGADLVSGAEDQQLREIKDEAEEVLRVLKETGEPDAVAEAKDEAGKPESQPTTPDRAVRSERPADKGESVAEVLDEESSDPEIQLDLARAYISMGDKEAARVILEEVGNNGNEEQREEAKKMLSRLTP